MKSHAERDNRILCHNYVLVKAVMATFFLLEKTILLLYMYKEEEEGRSCFWMSKE